MAEEEKEKDEKEEKQKDEKEKKSIVDGFEIIIDEAGSAVRSAFRRSGAETLGENLKETIQSALLARDNVVMVRLNQESLNKLDELVEAGILSSRSEAAAFLIGEGAKARADIFDRISEKIEKIRAAKQELRDLLNESPIEGVERDQESEKSEQDSAEQDPEPAKPKSSRKRKK